MSPLAISALLLLLANDHDFKQRWPGWWTGKLSDLAVLVLLPIVSWALVEHARGRAPASRRCVLASCLLAGLLYTAMETWAPASLLYRAGLAVLQWPLRSLLAGYWVELRWVRHVSDAEDLIVLPALLLPWWYGTRRAALHDDASVSLHAARAERHTGRR